MLLLSSARDVDIEEIVVSIATNGPGDIVPRPRVTFVHHPIHSLFSTCTSQHIDYSTDKGDLSRESTLCER